jgi:hypothetical protein
MSHRLRQYHQQAASETGSFRRLVEGTLPVEKYVERLDQRVRERERNEERPLRESSNNDADER